MSLLDRHRRRPTPDLLPLPRDLAMPPLGSPAFLRNPPPRPAWRTAAFERYVHVQQGLFFVLEKHVLGLERSVYVLE